MSIRLPLSDFSHKCQVQKLTVSPLRAASDTGDSTKVSLIERSELFPPQINFPSAIILILSLPRQEVTHGFCPVSHGFISQFFSLRAVVIAIWLNLGLCNADPCLNNACAGDKGDLSPCWTVPYILTFMWVRVWHHPPLCQSLAMNRDGGWWRLCLTKPPLVNNIRMKRGHVTAAHHDEQPVRREWICRMFIKETPDVTSRCH